MNCALWGEEFYQQGDLENPKGTTAMVIQGRTGIDQAELAGNRTHFQLGKILNLLSKPCGSPT